MSRLDALIEAEIAELGGRYGQPRRVDAALEGTPFNPLTKADRIGEVCMVVRRRTGTLLTAIKDFYPPGAFRLLTGGVEHGERIEAALLREVAEETGLDIAVARFLAVISYASDGAPAFATFAFLLDEVGGALHVADPAERIAAFGEVTVAELPQIAATLDALPDVFDEEIGGVWRDWGRFRAVVHRVVHAALTEL